MTSIIFTAGKYLAKDGTMYRAGMTANLEKDEADSVVRANIARYTDTTKQETVVTPVSEQHQEPQKRERRPRVVGEE